MKYYVIVSPPLYVQDNLQAEVRERMKRRQELRKLGFVVEYAEVFNAWCVEFETEEEAALFKLTHL